MKTKQTMIVLCCLSFCLSLLIGCQSSTGTGTLVGAGLGQLIGGDSKATLIGAGVGAGVGYLLDASKEKQAAEKRGGGGVGATLHVGS